MKLITYRHGGFWGLGFGWERPKRMPQIVYCDNSGKLTGGWEWFGCHSIHVLFGPFTLVWRIRAQ